MRTFACLTYGDSRPVPSLSFIFAPDEIKARILAFREVREADHGVSTEVFEDGRFLFEVTAQDDAV